MKSRRQPRSGTGCTKSDALAGEKWKGKNAAASATQRGRDREIERVEEGEIIGGESFLGRGPGTIRIIQSVLGILPCFFPSLSLFFFF